jgi:hypothetical protein
MTLPFRRRHHDDESAHDRARALTSKEMLEALPADEAGWLVGHLDDCAECRQDRAAYLADRELLRSLRERTPEPPRDLWARTSAALDREARGRAGQGALARAARGARTPAWRRMPFGAMAGALIVLVVLGASLIPPIGPVHETPGGSGQTGASTGPEPTELVITAGRVGWVRPADNGSWELVFADVATVCPQTRPSCHPLAEDNPTQHVNLGGLPTGLTISPHYDQLVVEAHGSGATPDRIFVLPVAPATPPASPAPTDSTTPTAPSTTPATPEPATPEPGSPEPSITPEGVIEIASGVMIVGEAAYSEDGKWLAFSARPSDGSTGPDLYLWSVGAPTAIAVTSDHQTYFSSWLGDGLLASRVVTPLATTEAAAASSSPDASASGEPGPIEAHPTSFLLDPDTLVSTDIAAQDVWLPVVDSTGRFVAHWAGTLRSTTNGRDWELGKGDLVLDRWSAGPGAAASSDPAVTADPSAPPAGLLGPAGTPVIVGTGHIAAFKAKFDPSGTRLAIWVGEQADATIGRLQLIVLNASGGIDPDVAPLRGAPALRRFSIDVGRLAWVTPSGQDGQESAVHVLGWSNFDFGEIRTVPSKDLYIVH